MDYEAIRYACERSPFTPFVLTTVDGRTFPIDHPEFVNLLPAKMLKDREYPLLTYYYADGSLSLLDARLIVSIDPLVPTLEASV